MVSIDQIEAFHRERARIESALQDMGRAIYEIREGKRLDSVYQFESYSLQDYQGDHFHGQDGPDWGVGTPIISIEFYWARFGESIWVTLPQAWLGGPWRRLEAERVAAERAENERQAKAVEEDRLRAIERSEREQYERLKAKYGGE